MANRPADELEDPEDLEEEEDVEVDLAEVAAVDDDETDDTDESDDADEEAGPAVASGDDEDSDQASLEEILAKRASARRGRDDPEEDIMTLVGGDQDPVAEPLPIRARPMQDRQEFVCKRCHLVKPRVQLADAKRGLCRDCA